MKIKLGARIVLGFGFVLLIVAILVGISLNSMNNIRAGMNDVMLNAEKIKMVDFIQQAALTVSKITRGSIVFSNDPTKLEQERNELAVIRTEIGKALESLGKITTAEEKELLQKYIDSMNISKPINTQVTQLIAAGKFTEASNLMVSKADPLMRESIDKLIDLKNYIEQKDKKSNQNAITMYAASFSLLMTLGIICIILGAFGAYFITRSITKPINKMVASITESSTQVAAASNQLASASQQLSEGSVEQACSIEETSSTLQESASMLQQNSANTKQAAQLSEHTKDAAEKGNNEMQEMMNSIDEIKKSSDQIAKIIKVIDDIAFQTNILALNAAVEAARAGEAGMGFAVVAEEVRNLAQRSAQAAKDTSAIIENNIELSGKGVTVAGRVKDALSEITTQAKKVSELMEEIAAASQEQSQGIEQVNKAIAQMETVTQQNSSNAEESASASEELSAQAQNLQEIVKQLSELVNGKAARELEETALHQVKHLNINQSERAGLPERRSQSHQPKLEGSKTKVISPEDVIPLEKDNKF